MEEAEGGGEAGGRNEEVTKRAGAPCKRLRPPFLRLWGLFLLPWASRLGGRLALQPIAEMGGLVAVKENNKSEPIAD